jgi:hypothetical protein
MHFTVKHFLKIDCIHLSNSERLKGKGSTLSYRNVWLSCRIFRKTTEDEDIHVFSDPTNNFKDK